MDMAINKKRLVSQLEPFEKQCFIVEDFSFQKINCINRSKILRCTLTLYFALTKN
jgi:hypothetical protein